MPFSMILVTVLPVTIGLSFGLLMGTRPWFWPQTDPREETTDITTFLFQGDRLIDATPGARSLIDSSLSDITRGDIARLLEPRFHGLTDLLGANSAGTLSDATGLGAQVDRLGETTRLTLTSQDPASATAMQVLNSELCDARSITDAARAPIWRVGPDGAIDWANEAYLALCTDDDGTGVLTWPLAHVFDHPDRIADAADGTRMRLSHGESDDCFRVMTTWQAGSRIFTAWPEDRAVAAENQLRGFKMALSNTFAHLSVGLAVFDRDKRLTLFNPALTDLTGMDARHLIDQPGLSEFLDRLREARLLPEPKNYAAWKTRVLETGDAGGESLNETWPLSDGRTLHVCAQPHGDGAIAFVFEDITSEIAMTRSFRSELELGQQVLDLLDDGIAVFSATGTLMSWNKAYMRLWGCEEALSLASEHSLIDASRYWSKACVPTPVWGDVRDFAAALKERAEWEADVTLRNGRNVHCRFEPLGGGAMLAVFRQASSADATAPRLLEQISA